jgi:hypothetical protein
MELHKKIQEGNKMSGGKFDYNYDGVTYSVEFDIDQDGQIESMGVFVSDSPDISAVCSDTFLKKVEKECFEHFPEPYDFTEDR